MNDGETPKAQEGWACTYHETVPINRRDNPQKQPAHHDNKVTGNHRGQITAVSVVSSNQCGKSRIWRAPVPSRPRPYIHQRGSGMWP